MFFGDWHTGAGFLVAALRVAMEFCGDWLHQSSVFRVVLCPLSKSERGQITDGHGARVHRPRRSAAGRSRESRRRSSSRLLAAAAQSVGPGPRFRVLQLHFLSAVDLAAVL